MDFGEKDVKKISTIVLLAVLLLLAFLILKPFLFSVIGGLLLAYIFMPLHRKIRSVVKNKSVSASLVAIIIVVGLLAILWFIAPILIKQSFEILITSQKLNMQAIVKSIFPTASEVLTAQLTTTLNSIISNAFSSATNFLTAFLANLPKVILNFFILGFIFFFALRDSEKLSNFVKSISPLSESKEKVVVKHFKDMTGAIIYGWIIVGIVQGILAGLGLFIFGIKNALVLTLVAILLSIIPFLGPAFVWIPVSIYLLTTGNTSLFVAYLLYNLFIVSLADNILRSYIISRRTDVPPAIILLGMLGGIFVFGVVGLVIGPLILAYLLTLLESFKDKSIYSLFA